MTQVAKNGPTTPGENLNRLLPMTTGETGDQQRTLRLSNGETRIRPQHPPTTQLYQVHHNLESTDADNHDHDVSTRSNATHLYAQTPELTSNKKNDSGDALVHRIAHIKTTADTRAW